jgi:hypothetical protein
MEATRSLGGAQDPVGKPDGMIPHGPEVLMQEGKHLFPTLRLDDTDGQKGRIRKVGIFLENVNEFPGASRTGYYAIQTWW